ncbi:MAG TPA: PKD domain-containing protein [Candidatus Thermoplasmatota archaeon]|nr:PKD domain-containing protein [Candidatus Thermoplasmatota archaeon]
MNATDPTGSGLYTRKWYIFVTQQPNAPPKTPNRPSGIASGKVNTLYTYTTSTIDPNGDQVYYNWSWGDGNYRSWLGPFGSGATATANHSWTKRNTYSIKVKAKDIFGTESTWSDPLSVKMPYAYNIPIRPFLAMLFERFPHAFPILGHLLRS